MRPGRLGPGRRWRFAKARRWTGCFNEAGAIRPRKDSQLIAFGDECRSLQ